MPNVATKVKKVPNRSRTRFLPKHFGNYFLNMENTVFNLASRYLKNYENSSGYWDFYETENGDGFMVPAMTGPVTVDNIENFSVEKMSPEAAGLTLTILALNNVARRTQSHALAHKWEALMDFARDHEESSKIMAILD